MRGPFKDVHELLESISEFAEKNSEAIAITENSGRSFTWGRFFEMVHGYAALFRESGLVPGDVVAITCGRTAEYVAAQTASIYTGNVALCIDPLVPDDRKAMMIAGCKAKLVVDGKESLSPTSAPYDYPELPDMAPGFLVFTSGSTGVPKGILHPRATYLHFSNLASKANADVSGMSIGFMASISFVASTIQVMVFLSQNSSLSIIDDALRADIAGCRKYLIDNKVESILLNPTYYRALGFDMPFKIAVISGERSGFMKKTDTVVVNVYGSSEVMISASPLTKDTEDMPIGEPLDGSFEILDENGNPSDEGELVFTGNGLMLGYLHDIAVGKMQGKTYRTGDIARRLPDGIHIIGRIGDMVKINGQRVETGDVEETLYRMEGITGVAVKAFDDAEGRKYLCGFYQGSPTEDEVRKWLSVRVNHYMIPRFIVRMDRLPVNRSGKIDKLSLQAPDASTFQEDYVEPADENEKAICDAFAEVLKLERVGAEDDFIMLGGDSLKAIEVQNTLEIDVSVMDILEYRTPRNIAPHVKSSSGTKYTLESGRPLNNAQMNVLNDVSVKGTDEGYVLPLSVPLTKDVNAQYIVDALVDAHPILGFRLELKEGGAWLVPGPRPTVTDSLRKSFDLFEGPLCSFTVDDGVFKGTISHFINDGTSRKILENDVRAIVEDGKLPFETGFLNASDDSDPETKAKAVEFYDRMFENSEDANTLVPCIESGSPKSVTFPLSRSRKELADLAHRFDTTIGSLLTAAFAYTYTRFTGSSIATFCTVNNGRDRKSLLKAVGMFVNTIPLCVECDDARIEDFVRKVHSDAMGAAMNSVLTMAEHKERYGMDFSIVFQYMMDMIDVENMDKEALDPLDDELRSKIEFYSFDNGKDIVVSGFFDKDHAKIAETFTGVFDRIVSEFFVKEKLSDIEYTSDKDLEYLEANSVSKVTEAPEDVMDSFVKTVKEYPDKPLVRSGDVSYTFNQTSEIVGGLADALRNAGITSDDVVAVLVERGVYYQLCAYAALAAGVAYIPIDGERPEEWRAEVLRESGARFAFSDGSLTVPEGIVTIDVNSVGNAELVLSESTGSTPAAIIYTSGTTGVSKGAVLTRGGISNLVNWQKDFMPVTSEDTISLHHGYSFCSVIEPIFLPAVTGCTVDVIPKDVRLDLPRLRDYSIEHDITILKISAPVGRQFLPFMEGTPIKVALLGGEKLGEITAPAGIRIADGYGPTENTVQTSEAFADEKIAVESVGKPVYNVKAYILDKEMRRVPPGAVGELFVAGPQVCSGYLNRPELSSGKLVDNPFTDDARFGRMYGTGDQFRFLPDGTLGYRGRIDRQVKVRGNRVELAEVESCIRAHPDVKDVAVKYFDTSDFKGLVGYVVSDNIDDPESIRSWISERKPDYMVPAHIVFMDAIPLSPSLKVDRRALKLPEMEYIGPEYVAPRNEIETLLCECISEAMDRKVGLDDDFIAMGGNSLKALGITAKFNSSGLGTLSVYNILKERTVRRISSTIRDVLEYEEVFDMETGCPLLDLPTIVYTLTSKQGLYLNINGSAKMPGWEPAKTVEAVKKVIEAHPILTAHVSEDDGVPYYVFGGTPEILSTTKDVDTLVKEGFCRPFNLNEGALSRFAVIDTGDGVEILISIHHTIMDAASVVVLADKVKSAYEGKPLPVDDGILRIGNYNLALMETEAYERNTARFIDLITELGAEGLPKGTKGSPGENGIYDRPLSVDGPTIDRICRKLNCTRATLFTLVYSHSLGRLLGRDIIYAQMDSGRTGLGLNDSVGCLFRGYPMGFKSVGKGIYEFISENVENAYDLMSDDRFSTLEVLMTTGWFPETLFQYAYYLETKVTESARRVDGGRFGLVYVSVFPDGDSLSLNILYPEIVETDSIKALAEVYNMGLLELVKSFNEKK